MFFRDTFRLDGRITGLLLDRIKSSTAWCDPFSNGEAGEKFPRGDSPPKRDVARTSCDEELLTRTRRVRRAFFRTGPTSPWFLLKLWSRPLRSPSQLTSLRWTPGSLLFCVDHGRSSGREAQTHHGKDCLGTKNRGTTQVGGARLRYGSRGCTNQASVIVLMKCECRFGSKSSHCRPQCFLMREVPLYSRSSPPTPGLPGREIP